MEDKFSNSTHSDGDVVIGEDESGVDAGELGVGHDEGFVGEITKLDSQVADFRL